MADFRGTSVQSAELSELPGRDALAIVEDLDIVEGVIAGAEGTAELELVDPADRSNVRLTERNLFGEADRIAARASSAGTRRQYATIYRRFGHWLRDQLGRPRVDEGPSPRPRGGAA